MERKKVVIMGAAGRDFHNFNVFFRNNEYYNVVCFTAAQIPGIAGRNYPPSLAGKLYPKGIPVYDEKDLTKIIKENNIDIGILAYSDLDYTYVMRKASEVLAAGADFRLMGPKSTMLKSKVPIISVCAVRTGCGKSAVSELVVNALKEKKKKVVVIRHPMPYGDLEKGAVQRFETRDDLNKYNLTIEEREEYEHHLNLGCVVYAGVDYEKILRNAEKESDYIIWDGGNNDLPFYKPDLHIVIADALRPGHEISYYPGEVNARMADILIINKVTNANKDDVLKIMNNLHDINPNATIVQASAEIVVENIKLIKDRTVLVIEDGPTLTHGGMKYGVAYVAAKENGAKKIINPKKYAVGSIKGIIEKYKLGKIIPAMGYSKQQMTELQATINAAKCDTVLIGTPIRLERLFDINKPFTHIGYAVKAIGTKKIKDIIYDRLKL
ncbi:MAG: GTPase [Candidatus Diapherotrites archaeon]|nr:GTPase [Candidatus Diapherotrites archaeon]